MASTVSIPNLEFKQRDSSSYDDVVGDFDRFTERYTRPLAAKVNDLAAPKQRQRILDIGSGTGIVAFEAARRVGAEGRVVGIDLSEGMLERARRKAVQLGLGGTVQFRQMDAERLELEPESFDSVLSLFALLHFPDPVAALREMYRVLKPGATIVVAVGSGPAWLSITGLLHRLGRLPTLLEKRLGRRLNAPGFLNELVTRHIPATEEQEETDLAGKSLIRTLSIPRLLRRAGFSQISASWKSYEGVLSTPEEFWRLQSTYSSIARKRLAHATADQLTVLKREFYDRCKTVGYRGGKFYYPYAALFVSARRPSR